MKKIQLAKAENKSLHWRGIEPRSPAWQARILPLNQQCSTDRGDLWYPTGTQLSRLLSHSIDPK